MKKFHPKPLWLVLILFVVGVLAILLSQLITADAKVDNETPSFVPEIIHTDI